MKFDKLELVKEYPNQLGPGIHLRLYRTEQKFSGGVRYRWHFGYQRRFISRLCPLIETTPFWGEEHWADVDGFWIWWTPVVTDTQEIPEEKLNIQYNLNGKSFHSCVDFLKRASESST